MLGHRPFRCVVLVAAIALLLPAAVVAHAALKSASPGPDDTISVVPDALVAHFTQNLDPAKSSVELRDGNGRTLARGSFDQSASDKRTMRMDLPDLTPGTYEVRWTTLSTEDDELDRDTYAFTVLAPSPSPSPSATPGASPSATPASPSTSPVSPSATPAPPSSTPASTPSPTATTAPTSASSPPPGSSPPADAGQIAIPIGAALAFVAVLAIWLLRRRSTR